MFIRHETDPDRSLIYAIHAAVFPSDAEAQLVDCLRADGDLILSLVCESGGAMDGHIAFSQMRAPFRALGLAPLSVLPARQRAGIGSALIREGLSCARAQGWEGVFVLGDNAYYERFGFRAALAKDFSCRFAGPHFMALSLNGGSLPAREGDVAYAPAFDALD